MANFSSTYPSTRPVFNADFSNAGRLDSRITFSRSDTPPTYAAPSAVHYWSNEKHLSSENLIPNSNTNAAWQTFDVTKSVSGSFLDGSDSLLVSETANTAIHYISPNVGAGNSTSFVSGTEYTAVMYAKAGTDNIIQVGMTSGAFGANAYANYDLSNAATPPVTGSSATATITALGSDWVKLTLTATATSSATGTGMFVAFTDNNINAGRAPGYAGDTAANVYLWEGNVSSTGQKHLVETNGQIHREYAPTLKSVSTAGQPRFEYSPTDSASMGLLIEGSSTNLVSYSESFSNQTINNSTLTEGAAVGPDGTLNANLLVPTSTGATGRSVNLDDGDDISHTSGNNYAFSIYAKSAGYNYLQWVGLAYFGSTYCNFDLSNGTVGNKSGSVTGSVESVGNGWYRLTVVAPATTTNNTGSKGQWQIVESSTSGRATGFTGDDYSGVLLTMAQCELGSFASSYIKSDSGSVSGTTRAADSASAVTADIGYTGGPVSMQVDFRANVVLGKTHRIAGIENTRGVLRPYISAGGDVKMFGDVGGTTVIDTSIKTDITANTDYSVALRWDTNDYRGALDGTLGNADTTCPLPDFEGATLYVGTQSSSGFELDGHVKRLAIYPALTDTNLQALTK